MVRRTVCTAGDPSVRAFLPVVSGVARKRPGALPLPITVAEHPKNDEMPASEPFSSCLCGVKSLVSGVV